jgi:conjugative transposon TraN protein
MKKISAVMATGIFLVLTSINTFSQEAIQGNVSAIEPFHLAISFYKTTSLIFPYAIKSVDRGSRDVLVQKAKGVENILQVKAAKSNFKETNLTVITADGKFYSWILNYMENSSFINILIGANADNNKSNAFFSPGGTNEANIHDNAKIVANEKRSIHGISDKKYKMKLQLNGLYIKDEVMYCKILLENNSNINYDIEMLGFYINDERKTKRTASQQIELQPLYVYGDTSVIYGQSKQVFVFALPKFTIPEKKYLFIQIMEKNGGRHLQLRVHNRTIVKARSAR